jgi:hypothetical protein
MGKSIRMQRDELVWETRINYFTEEDWNRVKEWLKDFLDREGADDPHSWVGHQVIIYNCIKDLTFEEVLADFERFEEVYESDDCIQVELTNKSYNGDTWTYNQFLHDLVIEWVREDNYESDVVDSQYADDYQEYVEIVED